jgi:hypothetical protein
MVVSRSFGTEDRMVTKKVEEMVAALGQPSCAGAVQKRVVEAVPASVAPMLQRFVNLLSSFVILFFFSQHR